MSTDQVLSGVALILLLAVGSQVAASRLRIPALIILLPAGFAAGALTTSVDPERLLGPAFRPLVSLSVAVILYDAGLALELDRRRGTARSVVLRLIIVGVPVTWAFGAVFAGLLLGMSRDAAVMLGAIVVVSGPTVVGPLLDFTRPTERLRRALAWEGSLIDPVGGILGAVVFQEVIAGGYKPGQFMLSVAVGAGGAAIGVAVLWFCLCKLDLGEVLATSSQLACVVGVAAACDIGREDSGLIAAVLMGLALANLREFDVPARRPFFENLVQLIIGVLFVSISATVTPQSLRHLLLPTLGLVAVLVLVTRPLVAFLATSRTDMTRAERQFMGWMAPRGIIAAATASTFGAGLAAHHVGGAAKILPVTFLVIAMTVALYGLTAVPVARHLGVIRSGRARPLLVGGASWVIDLARALRQAGLDVLMWAASQDQRDQIRQAAFELAPGELLSSAVGGGAELEGITCVLLLTDEDDFNALAATVLASSTGPPVYRLGPRQPGHGVVAPCTAAETLFGTLTRYEVAERYAVGARISLAPASDTIPPGAEVLFLITPDRALIPATTARPPAPKSAGTLVLLTADH